MAWGVAEVVRLLGHGLISASLFLSIPTIPSMCSFSATSGGAMIPGVDGFLADRLGVPVEIFNPLESIRLGARKFDAQSLGQMAPMATVAIGLATRRFDYI